MDLFPSWPCLLCARPPSLFLLVSATSASYNDTDVLLECSGAEAGGIVKWSASCQMPVIYWRRFSSHYGCFPSTNWAEIWCSPGLLKENRQYSQCAALVVLGGNSRNSPEGVAVSPGMAASSLLRGCGCMWWKTPQVCQSNWQHFGIYFIFLSHFFIIWWVVFFL